ncbi:MAG: DUF1624 domain-containing protein [Firmicutes bacterium]|nr:DUF1624 domain-containing protein [Bacillota bacterium]
MNRNTVEKLNHGRDHWLDHLRGATLVSMILYHGCWDLVYLLEFDWDWYRGTGSWFWQQSICWTFIILSGYCWSMGRHHWKRGCITFGAGALVTVVTVLLMPSARIICGVLTLLGSAALLMIPLDRVLKRVSWKAGLMFSFGLFILFRNVNRGWLGIGLGGTLPGMVLIQLPERLYRLGLVGAWIGFMPHRFFSTDYFSILPWFFLFCAGYYLRKRTELKMVEHTGQSCREILCQKLGTVSIVLEWMGRNSLFIYLIHQPVLYGAALMLGYLL